MYVLCSGLTPETETETETEIVIATYTRIERNIFARI